MFYINRISIIWFKNKKRKRYWTSVAHKGGGPASRFIAGDSIDIGVVCFIEKWIKHQYKWHTMCRLINRWSTYEIIQNRLAFHKSCSKRPKTTLDLELNLLCSQVFVSTGKICVSVECLCWKQGVLFNKMVLSSQFLLK